MTNHYSLRKFDSFHTTEYAYRDVLQIMYGIESGADIVKIVVSPSNMDNTKEEKAIQKEIVTKTITDVKNIVEFYDIISEMICYGGDRWNLIGLDDGSAKVMQNQVRKGRYLTLVNAFAHTNRTAERKFSPCRCYRFQNKFIFSSTHSIHHT